MSEQTPQRPQYPPGEPGRDDDCSKPKPPYPDQKPDPKSYPDPKDPKTYPDPKPDPYPDPKPEPKPCPDPCDGKPKYGPPQIPAECCTPPECCQPKEGETWCCTWDEIDDPCVRASACGKWTKVTCKCESSNADCKCNGFDCGSYPQGTCVPCEPCKGLPTPPDTPPGDDGGGNEPPGDGCGPDDLKKRLGAVKKAIQDAQKKRDGAAADLKASQESEKELNALIASIDVLVKSYTENLHKLKCREDCLKGFHRDMTKHFNEQYSEDCLKKLTKAINDELCEVERRKCCVKYDEGRLTCTTKIVWEKHQAEKQLAKAEEAFKAIKDLPKWIADQFSELEAIRDLIVAALADKDKKKHHQAFYLFYWKFVPGLCKRFKVALCCCPDNEDEETTTPPAAQAGEGGDTTTPTDEPPHFGCVPGEWHPSRIDIKRLRELVCCALSLVDKRKKKLREATDAIAAVTQRIEAVKAETLDAKGLEEKIKTKLEGIVCGDAAAPSTR
jgi:hypothetical protein